MEYEEFLNKHNINDKSLRNKLIEFHNKTIFKNRYNSMYGQAILNSFDLKYEFDNSLFKNLLQYIEFLIKGNDLRHCEICNDILKFDRKFNFCEKCKKKYIEIHKNDVKEKRRKTCYEKYGCDFPTQNIDIQKKTKQTNIKKYGCNCALQNIDVHNKTIETNLKKYRFYRLFII